MSSNVVWRKPGQIIDQSIPGPLRPWLLEPGSLTKRLKCQSEGDFRVEVVKQCWELPRRDERRALSLPDRRFTRVREVRLRGFDEPWVYARTVMPAIALQGHYRCLRYLDNRPLGHILHHDPRVRHGPFEIACLCANRGIWARRRLYYLGRYPILVRETFLVEADSRPWRN